eukprot:m.132856 g.132856  ORF g.132856 m.132856 type:complete len:70 (-) comp52402_c0_seq3:169-378(-)
MRFLLQSTCWMLKILPISSRLNLKPQRQQYSSMNTKMGSGAESAEPLAPVLLLDLSDLHAELNLLEEEP